MAAYRAAAGSAWRVERHVDAEGPLVIVFAERLWGRATCVPGDDGRWRLTWPLPRGTVEGPDLWHPECPDGAPLRAASADELTARLVALGLWEKVT